MFSTFWILLASMKETKVTHTKKPLKDRGDSSHDWTIHSKISIPQITLSVLILYTGSWKNVLIELFLERWHLNSNLV